MTRIDWIAWLGMVAALLLIGPCRAGNLAPDPGFETAGPGGSPAGWHAWGGSTDASPAQQDRNRPHTGEACLRVTNPPGGSHFYTASDTIPADPGQCYLLTAWGRADREKVATIRLDMLDGERKFITTEAAHVDLRPAWGRVGLVAAPIPAGMRNLQVSLEPGEGEPGTAWFDDIELTALGTRVPSTTLGPDPATWKPFPIPWRDPGTSGIDVSFLLDAPTGKHGFLTTGSDGHFHFRDGTRARFWGTNLHASNACFPSHDQAESIAARLARQGVNMVRTHLLEYDAPGGLIDPEHRDAAALAREQEIEGSAATAGAVTPSNSPLLSPSQLEKFDYLLYQFHQRGIYVILDGLPMCARRFHPGDGLPADVLKFELGAPVVSYFDPQIIALERDYARQLFGHVNAYTKRRLADDPTIGLVEMTNENTLFLLGAWWTELPPYYRNELQALWNEWLRKRYPDRSSLEAAWKGSDNKGNLAGTEDPEKGTVLAPARPEPGEFGERGADWGRFLAGLQRKYQQDQHAFLRGLGIRVPITASNIVSHPIGQATYDVLDFTDHHAYWDDPRYENGMEASLRNEPMVKADPLTGRAPLLNDLSVVKMAGKPCVVTEWNSLWPNRYRAADVIATTAGACLQDWDALFIYSYMGGWGQTYGEWDNSIPHATVLFADPAEAGLFPACAALFLRHDVSPARSVVEVVYDKTDLEYPDSRRAEPFRFVPQVSRIQRRFTGDPGKEAAVTLRFRASGEKPAKTDSGRTWILPRDGTNADAARLFTGQMRSWGLWKRDQGWQDDRARSDTGQVTSDWKEGITLVDTPATQSAAGFIGGQSLALSRVTFDCAADFATLTVTSLDGKPVDVSDHLLLTAVGRAENTGQRLEVPALPPELTAGAEIALGGSARVAAGGGAPVLIEPIQAAITLHRSPRAQSSRVFALDPGGKRMGEVPVNAGAGSLRFTIGGAWRTIYYEMMR